jgi:hypothetical protein
MTMAKMMAQERFSDGFQSSACDSSLCCWKFAGRAAVDASAPGGAATEILYVSPFSMMSVMSSRLCAHRAERSLPPRQQS